jgi:hypothetical protein
MPTLIVSDWLPNGSRPLAAAAQQAGWNVVCLKGRERPPERPGGEVIYYGGTDVAHVVTRRLGRVLIEPTFDWLAQLPEPYRRRPVRSATVAEARRLTIPAFLKPADPMHKCFDSGVYPGGWAIPDRRGFPDSTPVLIAEPVAWEVEYRCFLLDGAVTTLTPYARAGRWVRARDGRWVIPEAEAQKVLRFCRTLASDRAVRWPPAFTLDVGVIADRGWAVVEANPVWSSGLYGCEPAAVLPVLRRACLRRDDLTEEDWRWVVNR